MKLKDDDRLVIVNDLLNLSKPLHELKVQLGSLNWDYDGVGAELLRRHCIAVLQRYIQNELSAIDVEDWANLIEGREDIYFESNYEKHIGDLIYELANPALVQALDVPRAVALLRNLEAQQSCEGAGYAT